ncbi:L-aspartate dehydrogenase [Baekduia alba]|uniref:aspartate dehydrogenase n=1 Tax=Baekduia alba TaxID=2997333 RepID=UPI00234088F6|nr:aspartate dehydrogenase [Baekduia alba]WCB92275.1 L-aspartate dehydrogenase [Baekduia alba]
MNFSPLAAGSRSETSTTPLTRVGVAGLGAIGQELVRHLAHGVPGVALTAVSAHDRERAGERLERLGVDVPVVALDELEPLADVVVECAPARLLAELATPVLEAGKEVIVLSAGALLERPELIDLAARHGGRITVPTGALLGLDAVRAAAEGDVASVRMVTRKPARGLAGAPYLVENGVDPEHADEAVRVFSGTAHEAARGFPANLNVAAALALAGIGPERTHVEIWVDPAVERNTHTIEVDADVARLTMTIENVPSANPRTGRITALSVVSLLRTRHATLRVGS